MQSEVSCSIGSPDIVGVSPAMRHILELVDRVSSTDLLP